MNNDFSKKNRSKKVKYGPMLCFTFKRTSPVFRPPETSVIAAGSAEGGGAHRHRDAECGAAQAANRRRKPQGERRASASRPLVQRLHDSPGILMRDSRPPARKEAH